MKFIVIGTIFSKIFYQNFPFISNSFKTNKRPFASEVEKFGVHCSAVDEIIDLLPLLRIFIFETESANSVSEQPLQIKYQVLKRKEGHRSLIKTNNRKVNYGQTYSGNSSQPRRWSRKLYRELRTFVSRFHFMQWWMQGDTKKRGECEKLVSLTACFSARLKHSGGKTELLINYIGRFNSR